MTNERIPLLIDTDPGVDDALALLMAFNDMQSEHGRHEVVGLTIAAGNVGLGHTVANALKLCEVCGVDAPVQITEVAGVRLSQPSTIDCPTAIALKTWVESSLQPAFKGQVAQLKIAGHYVCRGRNNKRGAKISEHGRGKALDVSGLVLTDGSGLSIEAHYRKIKPLQAAYKGACGIFGTTLGPGSDGYHEDHLHFDTAKHRNGATRDIDLAFNPEFTKFMDFIDDSRVGSF